MKTPQFLQSTGTALAKGAKAAWLAAPWRVLRPLHALGERLADTAAETCREKFPQHYLQAVLGAAVAGVALCAYAVGVILNTAPALFAAATVTAAALPAAGIVALAAGATVAIGIARRSARRTEKYFLYEKDLEALELQQAPAP